MEMSQHLRLDSSLLKDESYSSLAKVRTSESQLNWRNPNMLSIDKE
jgi:hypothetical protein